MCSFAVFLAVSSAGVLGFTPDIEVASIAEIIGIFNFFLIAVAFPIAYFWVVTKPEVKELGRNPELIAVLSDGIIGVAMFSLSCGLFCVLGSLP